MDIAVIGINHKSADLVLREKLAQACQRRFNPEKTSHLGLSFVLLSTCNRTEIYFSSDDLALTHSYLLKVLRYDVEEEFEHRLYSYFGFDCFMHLASVTAGMDSAIVAETEIQGQVKQAYETAARHNMLSKNLHYLFQKSLKVGKEARSAITISRGVSTLPTTVVSLVESFGGEILFIGASEVNRQIMELCAKRGIEDLYLCNRSEHHVEGVQSLPWEARLNWGKFPVVVVATKASTYLVQDGYLDNRQLLIDLSMPRNIDPLLGQLPGVTLYNIDQLNQVISLNRQGKIKAIDRVEALIARAVRKQVNHFQQRPSLSVVEGLLLQRQ